MLCIEEVGAHRACNKERNEYYKKCSHHSDVDNDSSVELPMQKQRNQGVFIRFNIFQHRDDTHARDKYCEVTKENRYRVAHK